MAATVRRCGLAGLAAVLGGLLLLCGIAVVGVDAQLRSDAATVAVTLTADERERLEEGDIYESVMADAPSIRRSLLVQNLTSGGYMPQRYYEITEIDDGELTMSWGTRLEDGYRVSSWGGWQLKPVGILAFAGLSLLVVTGFARAARWESRHPLT